MPNTIHPAQPLLPYSFSWRAAIRGDQAMQAVGEPVFRFPLRYPHHERAREQRRIEGFNSPIQIQRFARLQSLRASKAVFIIFYEVIAIAPKPIAMPWTLRHFAVRK
jgi:hypothetical protein